MSIIKNVYDEILQGSESTEENARDYAKGLVWGEVEYKDQNIGYPNYIDTIEGIGIYYDYGADYYFFTNESIN